MRSSTQIRRTSCFISWACRWSPINGGQRSSRPSSLPRTTSTRWQNMGFHAHLPRYSSLPLIAQMAGDFERQTWGGLPAPSILCARASSDEHPRIFQRWAELSGAELHLLSAPATPDPAPDWWVRAREDWEGLYGTARLDLMVAEMGVLIEALERLSGRDFDHRRVRLLHGPDRRAGADA